MDTNGITDARRKQREGMGSERRKIFALEQIADSLEAIRHLLSEERTPLPAAKSALLQPDSRPLEM